MSEWDKHRNRYKNQNIMPSLANLERIFDIGDRLQGTLEVIKNMIENHELLPHGERAYKLVDELRGE